MLADICVKIYIIMWLKISITQKKKAGKIDQMLQTVKHMRSGCVDEEETWDKILQIAYISEEVNRKDWEEPVKYRKGKLSKGGIFEDMKRESF